MARLAGSIVQGGLVSAQAALQRIVGCLLCACVCAGLPAVAAQATPNRGADGLVRAAPDGTARLPARAADSTQAPFATGAVLRKAATLVGSDTVTNDNFGFAVGTYGTTAIVGAIGHRPPGNPGGTATGAAYIFARSTTGVWSQQAELAPPAWAQNGNFGYAVAVYDQTAVVTAPFTNQGDGLVAIYQKLNGLWALQQTIASSPGTDFGWSVALLKSTLIIGAPGSGPSGAAYVFVRGNSAWTQRAVLVPPSGSGGFFGEDVSISGTSTPFTVAVGAPLESSSTGAAYVFQGAAATWHETGHLQAADGAVGDQFGWSVANSASAVAVGANDAGGHVGAVYVFTKTASGYVQQSKIVPQDGAYGAQFGTILSMAGQTIVTNNELRGAVYVYTQQNGFWSQRAELVRGGLFGNSLDLVGTTLAVGDNSANASAGTAYLYRLNLTSSP